MDNLGLVTSTGPAQMAPNLFEDCVRRVLSNAPSSVLEAASRNPCLDIEYVYDGNVTLETKVFPTDSQKGN